MLAVPGPLLTRIVVDAVVDVDVDVVVVVVVGRAGASEIATAEAVRGESAPPRRFLAGAIFTPAPPQPPPQPVRRPFRLLLF